MYFVNLHNPSCEGYTDRSNVQVNHHYFVEMKTLSFNEGKQSTDIKRDKVMSGMAIVVNSIDDELIT